MNKELQGSMVDYQPLTLLPAQDVIKNRIPMSSVTVPTADMIRNRVSLAHELPSCAFYTFMNSSILTSLYISPSSETLVAGGSDSIIRVWNNDTPFELVGHSGAIYQTDLRSDSRLLLSASQDCNGFY